MKQEHGMTVNRSVGGEEEFEKYNVKLFPRMAQMIRDYQTIGSSAVLDTFCGLPHHLLLPRWHKQLKLQWTNLNRSTKAGENFQLLVFVNDVNQEVTEGSDGVEHM